MASFLYLLDTNIISEPTKVSPSPLVLERMSRHLDRSCICSVTWAEAMVGVRTMTSGKRQDALLSFLTDVIQCQYSILPFDEACATMYAHIVHKLKSAGQVGSTFAMMIASCAIAKNLVLVTRNESDFASIARHTPLMLENWFQ